MRATTAFVASLFGAVVFACAFGFATNFVFGGYMIGYSTTSVAVVSAIFGALAIVPFTLWTWFGARTPGFFGCVALGVMTGVVLYVLNVWMGMAGNALNIVGLLVCGAFGAAANIGAFASRKPFA